MLARELSLPYFFLSKACGNIGLFLPQICGKGKEPPILGIGKTSYTYAKYSLHFNLQVVFDIS
jgi:hypothetical protein